MSPSTFFYRLMKSFRQLLSPPLNTAYPIIIGVYSLFWGFWIANPFWDTFGTATTYRVLNNVGPEWAWGVVAIIVGLVMVWGVAKRSFRSLTTATFIGFMQWFAVSIGYFVANWQSTAGITTLAIAVYCGLFYLNLRVNRDNLPLENNTVKMNA